MTFENELKVRKEIKDKINNHPARSVTGSFRAMAIPAESNPKKVARDLNSSIQIELMINKPMKNVM